MSKEQEEPKAKLAKGEFVFSRNSVMSANQIREYLKKLNGEM